MVYGVRLQARQEEGDAGRRDSLQTVAGEWCRVSEGQEKRDGGLFVDKTETWDMESGQG